MISDRFLFAASPGPRGIDVPRPARREDGRQTTEWTDPGDSGALVSWDYRYTHLPSHAWSIAGLDIDKLIRLPGTNAVATFPDVRLYHADGSNRHIRGAAECFDVWQQPAYRSDDDRRFLVIGSRTGIGEESAVLSVYDVRSFEQSPAQDPEGLRYRAPVQPIAQFDAFEAVVTSVAFANRTPHVAFAVRTRGEHRLFVADAETLSVRPIDRVEHRRPLLTRVAEGPAAINDTIPDRPTSQIQSGASRGVVALSFSADDGRLLVAEQSGDQDPITREFEVQWEAGRFDSAREVGVAMVRTSTRASDRRNRSDVRRTRESNNESVLPIAPGVLRPIRHLQPPMKPRGDEVAMRRYKGFIANIRPRAMVIARDGFGLLDTRRNHFERFLERPRSNRSPVYDISRDGRWLLIGSDRGEAKVHDLYRGDIFILALTEEMEATIVDDRRRDFESLRPRRVHSGPVVGVALASPDPGRDYPAFATTIGEENQIKVWELYPVLDPISGLRSRRWVDTLPRRPITNR